MIRTSMFVWPQAGRGGQRGSACWFCLRRRVERRRHLHWFRSSENNNLYFVVVVVSVGVFLCVVLLLGD